MSTSDTTPAFVIGQIVTFKGYATDADSPILQAGERVKIASQQDDGSFVVYAVDRKGADNADLGDALFPDEMEATGNADDIPAPKAPKAPKGKKKEAAAVEKMDAGEIQAQVETAKAEKPAKGKGKKAAAKAEPVQTDIEDVVPAPLTTDEAFGGDDIDLDAPTGNVETGDDYSDVPVDPAVNEGLVPGLGNLSENAFDTGVVSFEDSASVRKILAESEDAIAAAKALAKRTQQNEFALGGVLHHIDRTGIWKTVMDVNGNPYEGKRGFTQFIKDHLDVDYRKARYLINIYATFRRLGKDERDLDKITWSKAKEIAAIANIKDEEGTEVGFDMLERDFDALAEMAEKGTRDDLVDHIKATYIHADNTKVKTYKVAAKFIGEAGDMVAASIEQAKPRTETGDVAAALELICGEWQLYNADLTLDQAIAALQNKYGVTLQVVQPGMVDETQDTVHTPAE